MSKLKSISLSLSSVALMAASPALADITADELWSVWQTQSANMGYNITATASPSGNGLVLTNVTNAMDIEELTLTAVIPQVTMTNNADGTVSLSMSDTLTYSLTGIPDDDAPDAINVLISQNGFAATASGSATNLTLDSSFAEMNVENVEFIGGNQSEIPEFGLVLAIENYAANASYDFSNPDLTGIDSTASLGSFVFNLDAREVSGAAPAPQPVAPQPVAPGKAGPPATAPTAPTGGSGSGDDAHLTMELMIADIAASGAGVLPSGFDYMAAESFPPGMNLSGSVTYGPASAHLAFMDRWENFDFSTSNSGGMIGFGISEDAISYELGGQNVQLSLMGSDMPFPISAAADVTGLAISMPLSQQPQPSPFAASVNYQGVTVGDQMWAMIDPTQAIPRGPATLLVDMTGTVQLFANLMEMDPMTMNGPPGELRELTLNNLQVSVAGAELTGTGDVDFAPGQIIPMPEGQVDLNLSGANGLIDILTQAGLLPPQQGGMIRGMLGMFAQPGATPDTYSSTIVFGPGGSITANGVPLQ